MKNGPKPSEGHELKPCSPAARPTAKAACGYTEWPEVTARYTALLDRVYAKQ